MYAYVTLDRFLYLFRIVYQINKVQVDVFVFFYKFSDMFYTSEPSDWSIDHTVNRIEKSFQRIPAFSNHGCNYRVHQLEISD